MNCKKCGSPLSINDQFCKNCGTPVNVLSVQNNNMIDNMNIVGQNNYSNNNQPAMNNNYYSQNINSNYAQQGQYVNNGQPMQQPINDHNQQSFQRNNGFNNNEKLGTASLIIGVICLVLLIPLNILLIPIAITGLVLGIVNKIKKGKKNIGIILNLISLLLITFFVILYYDDISTSFKEGFEKGYNYASNNNPLAGNYDCTGVDDHRDKYLITLRLSKDNTFLYGPYNNLENNYVKGTYTYEDEHKTNNSKEYQYYMLTFKGNKEDYIVDGNQYEKDFEFQMEFGIGNNNGKKNGVVIFPSSMNMYFCYEN